MLEDVSGYDYLALRLRVAGDPATHNSYFVNIQTDGPISTDLWQHRLYFRRQDNTWEEVFVRIIYIASRLPCFLLSLLFSFFFFFFFVFSLVLQIPFDNFVRTSLGEMSTNQMKMFREKVKSVGISMLGGNSGVEGKYELGIDTIRVVNEDDVVHAPISRFIY